MNLFFIFDAVNNIHSRWKNYRDVVLFVQVWLALQD